MASFSGNRDREILVIPEKLQLGRQQLILIGRKRQPEPRRHDRRHQQRTADRQRELRIAHHPHHQFHQPPLDKSHCTRSRQDSLPTCDNDPPSR